MEIRNRAVVIGLGGIGSFLLSGLAPFLNYSLDPWELVLVDGDKYEPHNHTRQAFTELGPKADVQATWVATNYSKLVVSPVPKYISATGEKDTQVIDQVVKTGDTVFSCVDNHKTRKVISKHCASLENVVLISGGNEYHDGNVQIFVCREGKNLTATLDKYHPEIAKPKDKMPHELSCDEAAVSSPQVIFSNFMAASLMLNAFYSMIRANHIDEINAVTLEESEVYFDIIANKVMPRVRKK